MASSRAATGPAKLPADRLHFGLSNGPSDAAWMTASGVPWRYRYTYLAGGVNTGNGWQTWQDPSLPTGQYALDYMQQSATLGAIPVLSYYMLLQSSPSTGADEAARDESNLNNATTMRAYYADFATLMQRAAQYGGQVVVHVEPDLWGYLEQQAAGGTAATVPASVASSGYPAVAGLPDTAQGFAWALLHLRDTLAPNVVMAVHASMWGAGQDVASSTDATLDAAGQADTTAAFLESAGLAPGGLASAWDVVFHDLDDHDAGWWEAQGADNQWFTHWWDATNQRFPNFARYLQWVGELHARTGVPQVAWQVPEGNQVYLTMNNTCGHYQDNVAQYLLGHTAAVAAAGVYAVLFGAGNACQTTNTDAQGDGVTNNGGVPTSDTAGGCTACNTAAATVADDDGGYLRTAVGAYYAAAGRPIRPLPVVSPPRPPSTAAVGVAWRRLAVHILSAIDSAATAVGQTAASSTPTGLHGRGSPDRRF